MQHAPYSIETTATICTAAIGIGITPLVRVPNHDAQWMSRVLDGGAQGVIVPDVNTSVQAEAIVSACRFPPKGKRSVMGLGPALGYRAVPLSELNPKLNAGTSVIVMLETAEGIENCEAVAAVDGIDVLLIGSGDLTTDLRIPGQVDHPRLRAAYERVAAACRMHNKVLGVGRYSPQHWAARRTDQAWSAVRDRRHRHKLRAGWRTSGHHRAACDQDRLRLRALCRTLTSKQARFVEEYHPSAFLGFRQLRCYIMRRIFCDGAERCWSSLPRMSWVTAWSR
jgi:2-keto-3-deoxy-L-rhamnonate aldolase RhmA